MAKDPAFNFYTNDFDSKTKFFSHEQVGMYLRLLMAQHQHGHLTEAQMMFICGRHDKEVFSKFDRDSDGKFFNERLEKEIDKKKAFSQSRANNRKGKNSNTSTTSVKHISTHMENENEKEKDFEYEFKEKESEEKPSSVVVAVEVLKPATFATPPDKLEGVYNDILRERLLMTYRDVDVDDQWKKFEVKVRAAPRHYADHTTEGLRLAFQKQLQSAPKRQAISQHATQDKKEKFRNL